MPATRPIETEFLFDARKGFSDAYALVSVMVSLYNYGHYIKECLSSVATQDYPRLEIIVVDDCSTDLSAVTAKSWLVANGNRFERALLIRHLSNEGPSQARNTAFLHSAGSHVFVLDADNSIYPRAISRLIEATKSTNAHFAYSQLEFFGREIGLGFADVWDPDVLAEGNYIDAMSLVRRDAWIKVGGYSQLDSGWEDFDFWCKFIEHGLTGLFVPETLCRYRVHESSRSVLEANPNQAALRIELNFRHPWLRL